VDHEPAAGGYVGRRRRRDDDTAGRSVDDLRASYTDDQSRSRHRRDDE
jgi:hypothetical protein